MENFVLTVILPARMWVQSKQINPECKHSYMENFTLGNMTTLNCCQSFKGSFWKYWPYILCFCSKWFDSSGEHQLAAHQTASWRCREQKGWDGDSSLLVHKYTLDWLSTRGKGNLYDFCLYLPCLCNYKDLIWKNIFHYMKHMLPRNTQQQCFWLLWLMLAEGSISWPSAPAFTKNEHFPFLFPPVPKVLLIVDYYYFMWGHSN